MRRKCAAMLRRTLPVALALAALLADGRGAHGLAGYVVLCAIPAGFTAFLAACDDKLARSCGGAGPACAAFALALLVTSAAVRSPSLGTDVVPAAAVSALVAAVAAYVLQGAVALFVPAPAPARARRRREREAEPLRRAA